MPVPPTESAHATGILDRFRFLRDWLGEAFKSVGPEWAKALAIAVALIQAALLVAALLFEVMLHADGSNFAYGIATGDAADLWWGDILSRATTYLLVVVPAQFIVQTFELGGEGLIALYGGLFYGLQLITYLIAISLAWKRYPTLLVFPAAQYALSSIMGYGFPSEVLISSGFVWISAMLVVRNQAFSIWFFLSFLALVFSHELAIPAACVIAYCAIASFRKAGAPVWKSVVFVVAMLAIAAGFTYARLIGGGATSNAIYVLDPRRLLNHPTAWLITASLLILLAFWLVGLRFRFMKTVGAVLGLFLVCVPVALHLSQIEINFELGRYGSARTMVGGALLFFVVLMFTRTPASAGPTGRSPEAFAAFIPAAIVSALALAAGANGVFIADHRIAATAIEDFVSVPAPQGAPEIVDYEDFLDQLPAGEASAVKRMNYLWTMRFRSVVVAPDYSPGRIINESLPYNSHCQNAGKADIQKGMIDPHTADLITRLSCGDQQSQTTNRSDADARSYGSTRER
ncbi:MAG: hypothetical protein WA989_13980 [Henriciella sp.]|uniref:hypothetical protein n=1 Tax=Henriciella sp. TaxID=1968823 RepID=UPI003C72EA56